MEPNLDHKFFRPSYIASNDTLERTGPVSVEDIKADLSDEFSLVSSNSDTNQSKGHIQVCLRIRPFTSLEKENEDQDCISIQDSTSILLRPPKVCLSRLSEKTAGQMIQKFTFSRVFGPEVTQEEFFEGTMKQQVQDFLDGYNRLIFTYGVTNAGKTYTFQGTEDDVGILPRTMDMLFKSIRGKLYTAMDIKPLRCRDYIKLTRDQVREEAAIKNSILRLTKEFTGAILTCNILYLADLEGLLTDSEQPITSVRNTVKFSVWVSFFEIYNECFYDLLIPVSNDKKRKTLRIAQDIKGYCYVKDLQWVQISDSKEASKLLKLGLRHQSIASTKLNTFSSRSHSIFTVKILKIEDSGALQVTRVNELSMCDLAGSERYTKTCNEGDRLKESGNINTSLLILKKCINALKNCQHSKLQQHIPFRESKLTHFLQGFFSGKGKVHMIVNISQCASAYDETLNVLKFSAIAQKVFVTDISVLPQVQSFGQGSSLLNDTKMPVPRKRATILWDRSLEDVAEDDDGEMEIQDNTSAEEAVQKQEENKVILREEDYKVCARATWKTSALLSLIEQLKSKLIAEKKSKLLLELKIREEVTQEFAQYLAERETDFKECISQERERLEENSERRLEIFKELVNSNLKNADENNLKDQTCIRADTNTYFEGFMESLQNDVADIKKQTEAAYEYIVSLENPQETADCLQKQLVKMTTELTKTKEELTKKTDELIKTEEELTQKTKGELGLKNNSNKVIKSSQLNDCEETVLQVGRKRHSENKPTVEGEPPAKKGTISTITHQGRKRTEQMKATTSENFAEILALKERAENLEGQLAALEEEYRREKNKEEEFNEQMTSLHLKLSASEALASGLSEELQQCRASYEEIVSELDKQKTINKKQEEKIIQLNKEADDAKQNIIDKVSQIKMMQSKVDELYKSQLNSSVVNIDPVNQKNSFDSQKDEPERAQVNPLCLQSQTVSTVELQQESSFHCSVESIWEECKNIIKISSQKSHQIQELLQQVEDLKKGLHDTENYNNQLKIKLNEIADQDHQSFKEKELMNQLQEQIQKTQDFEKQAAENHRVIAQLEEQVTNYKGKITELECLLETFRAKDDCITMLEELLKEKESLILSLESNTVALQEKCANSDKNLKELSDQEANLKEEIVQLRNSLEKMKHSLQEKEENEDKQIQSIKLLHKDLSESSALIQSLKKDLQRKEDEYTDLKDKFSDAKKQIQQVQNQICTMKSEEKSLRSKVNELQKVKSQFSEELKIKQCTILHLEKQLNKEKLEEISKQYKKTQEELRAKEKIIEDMRMTLEEQEQTQIKQDQVIEAKSEENNRLLLELEAWQQKCRELNSAENQSNSDEQKVMSGNGEENIYEEEELIKLQEELKVNYGDDKETDIELREHLTEEGDFVKEMKQCIDHESVQSSTEILLPEEQHKQDPSVNKEAHSEVVLDSFEVSTENEKTSRFPKPEMEIQFTPLQPNRIEMKHQDDTLPVTVKILKPKRKRKGEVLDEDFVKIENKKNASPAMTNLPSTSNKKMVWLCSIFEMSITQPFRKEYSLRNKESTSSKKSAKKKDGTLQKIGDFFQSPIIQSKAKKLIATISSPKSAEPESVKENELKPKKAKRKLLSNDISCPLNISASSVKPKQKESDHLILKRQLRSKPAK
ncbi:KI20B protein, partial [Urocolius indicus]|nr:KI20B protein [Urocolius indicus]